MPSDFTEWHLLHLLSVKSFLLSADAPLMDTRIKTKNVKHIEKVLALFFDLLYYFE